MVRYVPYVKGRNFDPYLSYIIKGLKEKIKKKNDDFLLFCTGTTGTGKSSLMMHAYEEYDPEGSNIKFIGLNRKDHSEALFLAKEKPGIRFCSYDEAMVSKRDHMQKYNKDLLQLYFQIRGINIFHWWNNPSVDILDKPFIEERLKGLIFIFTKNNNVPRLYYYFTKKALLQIWLKEKKLSHNVLHKNAPLAMFRGWFKPYKGKLWEPYCIKKDSKMVVSIDEFYQKYGQKTYSRSEAAKIIQVPKSTFFDRWPEHAKDLEEGKHYVMGQKGLERVTEKGLEHLRKAFARLAIDEPDKSLKGSEIIL